MKISYIVIEYCCFRTYASSRNFSVKLHKREPQFLLIKRVTNNTHFMKFDYFCFDFARKNNDLHKLLEGKKTFN